MLKLYLNVLTFIVVTCNKQIKIQEKIKQLEREGDTLLKELNVMINKNVNHFQKMNETEAKLAVNYLKDLKDEINGLNQSDIKDVEIHYYEAFNETDGFRRKAKKKSRDDFLTDLEKILKPTKISEKKLKEVLDNRDVIKKKLDDWILEREKEKEKIKKYRMQTQYLLGAGKVEKCPRFGFAGKKKKQRHDYASCKKKYKDKYDKYCNPDKKIEKPPRTPSSGRKKYPCCRKCCKKSYMGCL